jgi:hypothetical protein
MRVLHAAAACAFGEDVAEHFEFVPSSLKLIGALNLMFL